MFNKIILIAALLVAVPAAGANTITDLSRATGLSERNVRMLVGARTPHAEYRCCYNAKLKRFKEALGVGNYEKLMMGQTIVLDAKPHSGRRGLAGIESRKP